MESTSCGVNEEHDHDSHSVREGLTRGLIHPCMTQEKITVQLNKADRVHWFGGGCRDRATPGTQLSTSIVSLVVWGQSGNLTYLPCS
jgi:hypothetical protein